MCSTREARLARLRAAIDEVALAARADPAGHADPEELAERLAGLWAMIAELDPELARRLRGYCPDTSLGSWAQPDCGFQAWHRAGRDYFPTISTSIVAVTSGCSHTRT
jgi:hypothetical protein